MPISAPHLSYEEIGSGRVSWTIQERDYYQNDSGLWLEQDRRNHELVGGWHIFRDARVVCAINVNQGKVRIAPDRHDLSKYVEFDFGLSLSVAPHKDHIDVWREVPAWGAGSGFRITLHGKGLKFLIKFTQKNLIPDAVQFGLTASGLTFDGRKVMDGKKKIFTMPNLFAWAESDPDNHVDVPESLSGGVANIDLAAVKQQFAGSTGPWWVDPSIEIQPAVKDAMINEYQPTTNYGSGSTFSVYKHGSTQRHRSVISWDISSIPAGPVDSCSVSLYFIHGFNLGGGCLSTVPVGTNLALHRLESNKDWDESKVTWNIPNSGAPNWGGCYPSSTTEADKAIFTMDSTVFQRWHVWSKCKSIFDDARNAGDTKLHLLFKIDDEAAYPTNQNRGNIYYAKDYTSYSGCFTPPLDPALRPKLEILTTDIPLPAPRHTIKLDTSRRPIKLDTARRVMRPERNGGNL